MRTTEQMMDLIINVATADERIRAVCMNGSRTNLNVKNDPFQDFDIVYIVTDIESFTSEPHWIDVFGERIIMQTPEDMVLFPPELGGRFTYLMQLTDGNRIDLMLIPIEEQEAYYKEDSLTTILLDKDQTLPQLPPPTDIDYWVQRPIETHFNDCCNEFWWVSTYIAKGLWRKEMLYAQEHLYNTRQMLIQMLSWQVGVQTDFSRSVGKNGKDLERLLPEGVWEQLLATYGNASYESTWQALFTMCDLFQSTAADVAEMLSFNSNEEGNRVLGYLKHIQSLPRDSKVIF
ncbi:aminoglycoside 6-adenylyltransferase [Viridibacillus sp. YIM B01967]|uniref:Aminoglycoside 6-adenylyltransferase n=1 Tax=Viridibacillus soli TaxID=2798301 RepID=A0ABS1H8V2_9BACL|nr:aminoglycoside 6-adenylyltransferase [Viridibacillus soli]MBK3495841.1 aminoglycoside 6-adenylyltransferase [Viridibacillus soli]